jgi:hypothetical protein
LHLTLRIPGAEAGDCPELSRLIKTAPVTYVERDAGSPTRVIHFPGLPKAIDLALQLIAATVDMPRLEAVVNDRPVANLGKFWSALNCYRDSLAVVDVAAHCARRAARVEDAGACPDKACLSHCQFICTRCLQVSRERGAPPVSLQLRQIAVQAEVEWCPNLRL